MHCVLAATDNGGPVGCGCDTGTRNFPLRGSKCTVWEGVSTPSVLTVAAVLEHSIFIYIILNVEC